MKTNYPTKGSDGHAYLCMWDDPSKSNQWYTEKNEALATDANIVVQRCLIRGKHYGSDWTVRVKNG